MNIIKSAITLRALTERGNLKFTRVSYLKLSQLQLLTSYSTDKTEEYTTRHPQQPSAGSHDSSPKNKSQWLTNIFHVIASLGSVLAYYSYFRECELKQTIPDRAEYETDRDKDIKQLDAQFRSDLSKPVYLTGNTKCNKQKFAMGYAKKFARQRWYARFLLRYVAVAYLDASDYCHSLKEVTSKLGIEAQSTEDLYIKLNTFDEWLLIVDNVSQSEAKIQKVLKPQGKGFVLFVPDNDWVVPGDKICTRYDLTEMSESDAVQLLKNTSTSKLLGIDDKAAKELVKFLGYCRLSITSAGVIIKLKNEKEETYSFDKFRTDYGQEYPDEDGTALDTDGLKHKLVKDAIDLTVKHDEKHRQVFAFLACCGDSPIPDIDIPVIKKVLSISDSDFQDVLKFPLLRDQDDSKKTINLDGVTREELRNLFPVKDHLDVIRKLVQEMAQICREKDDDTPTALIPHMKHFEKVAKECCDCDYHYALGMCLGRAFPTQSPEADRQLNRWLKLCKKEARATDKRDVYLELGTATLNQGLLKKTKECFEKAKEEHKDNIEADQKCITFNHDMGEFEECRAIAQGLLDETDAKGNIEKLHLYIAAASVSLGEVKEAEMALRKISTKSVNLTQVLIRFNELKGRYDKSVKMLNNVLSDPEGSKEIDDELKAIYEAKLSTGYHFMNRDVQSKRCALKTIELVEELQEKNKHSTYFNIALTHLAPVYANLDEDTLKRAEKLLVKMKECPREPYFHYTRTVAQLGRVKQLLGHPKEAKKILEKLRDSTKLRPADHIGYRYVYEYLGYVYSDLNMWKESFEAFQKCEEIVTHYYKDKQHPDVKRIHILVENAQDKDKDIVCKCLSYLSKGFSYLSKGLS